MAYQVRPQMQLVKKIVSFEIRPEVTAGYADATDVTLVLKLECGHTETRDVRNGLVKTPKRLDCLMCRRRP